MRASFSCQCGAEVTAEGDWKSNQSADLAQRCSDCGEEFIITLSSLGKTSPKIMHDGGSQTAETTDVSGPSTLPRTDPLEVGTKVPDFELPGIGDEGFEMVRLSEYIEDGPVVLSFYPFDFSPVCESSLCRFRDSEWLWVAEDTNVFAISGDSTYAHRKFREGNDFQFPLLTDRLASVEETFGVKYDEWENQPMVCQRAIFGIDTDLTIRYRWHTEDANEEPDLDEALRWAEGQE